MSVPGAFFEVTGAKHELDKIMLGIAANSGRLTPDSSFSLDLWLEMKDEWFRLQEGRDEREREALARAFWEIWRKRTLGTLTWEALGEPHKEGFYALADVAIAAGYQTGGVTLTNQEARAERGFAYDRLTEADDEHVDAVRDRLYAAPCGMGVWVSVKDGTIVHGHGGNEREQWHWQKLGPWIKLDDQAVEWSEFGRVRRELDEAREQLAALRQSLTALAEGGNR